MSTDNLIFKFDVLGKHARPNKTIRKWTFISALLLCAINIDVLALIQSQRLVAAEGNGISPDHRGSQQSFAAPTKVNVSVVRKNQTIVFEPLSPRTVGDSEFLLSASASSGLPVSFSTSNPQVAIVEGNVVKIMGGGTAFLSASQGGNDMFHAAPMVIRMLTVNKLSQTIDFESLPIEIDTRTSPFLLNATASSGQQVTFSSSNASVIRIDGNRCTIVGAGVASILCTQFGSSKYDPALPVAQVVAVKAGIRESNIAKENVTVMPKPIGEWMFIGMNEFRSGEPVSVEIIDSRKHSIIRMTTKEQEQLSVNVAAMLPGVYYLELTQNEKKITSRFVKL